MVSITPHDRVFALTGAGISAESGIPTFRGEGGLWRGYRVEEVACPEAWERDPLLVWRFYSMRRKAAADKLPNPAHMALADLEQQMGDRLLICTQNVDSLHEMAGSRRVVHMHGRLFQSRCDTCTRPPFEDQNVHEEEIPHCECGGKIRPHICWFGEVPFELDRIFAELERCTWFIAVGTSGLVHPAAGFVAHARLHGHVRTAYVGPEQPANRAMFDQVLLGKAGELLPVTFRVSATLP